MSPESPVVGWRPDWRGWGRRLGSGPLGAGFWLLTTLGALAAVHLTQGLVIQGLEEQAIETKAAGPQTPQQYGVAFSEQQIALPDHVVHARFVAAPHPAAVALLIFHGNGEAVSDWAAVQARLHDAGVSSLVFDYSGFGNSSGRPSVAHMREDARAAYVELLRLTPQASRHVLLGHSLGNAVMLDAAASLQPAPAGLVVHAGFTSAREMAVQTGLVSPLLARLLPDVWDNEETLEADGPPLLVLHGAQDDVIPAEMGRRLAAAAGARSAFKVLAGVGHDDFYLSPSGQEWDPVVTFVNSLADHPDRAP